MKISVCCLPICPTHYREPDPDPALVGPPVNARYAQPGAPPASADIPLCVAVHATTCEPDYLLVCAVITKGVV